MKNYIDPTMKIARFQNESVVITETVGWTYITPVENLRTNESYTARKEAFSDLLAY